MGMNDLLKKVFRSKGYHIIYSSMENRYMLLGKGSSRTSAGWSVPGSPPSDGEAEMFLSMAENDSAGSIIYISPSEPAGSVRRILREAGVEIWGRAQLDSAAKDADLDPARSEEPTDQDELTGSIKMPDQTDIDPVKELREYRDSMASEVEGFKVHEIDLSRRWKDEHGEKRPSSDPSPYEFPEQNEDAGQERSDPGKAPVGKETEPDPAEGFPDESGKEEVPILADDDMFPMAGLMTMDEPLFDEGSGKDDGKTDDETSGEHDKGPRGGKNVPDDVLLDPWSGFDEWKISENNEIHDEPSKAAMGSDSSPPVNAWKDCPRAPVKKTADEARSIAGEKEAELSVINHPSLLLRTSYRMISEDGQDALDEESAFLYDVVRGEVIDLPLTLAEELESVDETWDGRDGPDSIPELKEGYNSAVSALRRHIRSGSVTTDRKTEETLMSTIYREVSYKLDPTSFKVDGSRRVVVPYWVRKHEGNVKWKVDGYLGRFVPHLSTHS